MDKDMAEKLVDQFARAVTEANTKLANDANRHYVARLRSELIEFLTGLRQ